MLLLKHGVHPPHDSIHTPRGITSANATYRGSVVTCSRCIPMTGWLVHEKCEPWNSAAVHWVDSGVQIRVFLLSRGHLDNVRRDVTVTTGRWYYPQVGRGQGCCETSYKAQHRSHKMSAMLRWSSAITNETRYFVCCCIPDTLLLINVWNVNKGEI